MSSHNDQDVTFNRSALVVTSGTLHTLREHPLALHGCPQKFLLIRAVNGVLLATDGQHQVHVLAENNLGEIEAQLDPTEFFRLNRSDLIHISSIVKAEPHNKESLAVQLCCENDLLLSSKTRTAAFRTWLNQ